MSALSRFRAEIDDFLQYHPQSPLDDDQQMEFRGLNYYDENPAYIFEAPVERFDADRDADQHGRYAPLPPLGSF